MRTFWPILWKEVLHVIRDPRSLGASLALPLLMLVMFGFAIRLDVTHVDVAVVDQDRSPDSRALITRIQAGGSARIVAHLDSADAIDPLLERRQAVIGIVIPPGYAEGIARGEAVPIQVIVDGTEASYAGQSLGLIGGIVGEAVVRDVRDGVAQAGGPDRLPGLYSQTRVLYNESLNGTWYIVPGLVAVIVSMLAALVTSQCVAREYERNTIEQILVSPVSGPALMLGKLVPYVGIGIIQITTVVLASRFLFGVPIRGSLLLLAAGTLLYLIGSMALGLMLSAVLKSQQVALQVSLLVTMLPSLLLSGFLFPIRNMALFLQAISYIVPARYFVAIARGLFLRGAGLDVLWPQFIAMTVFATVLLLIAVSRFRRTLS